MADSGRNSSTLGEPYWPGEEALSPEVRAVLACARAVFDNKHLPEFGAALAACCSIDDLVRTALTQKMLGHLDRLVKATIEVAEGGAAVVGFDPVLVNRVKELQRASAEHNLWLAARLLRLLDRLREAGVDAIPYKGPALSERLYGDATLRSSADLDLIVRHDHVFLARETLLASGFQDCSAVNKRLISERKGRWGAIQMQYWEGRLFVDLHWEIVVWLSTHPLNGEALLSRAETQQLLGREILGLSAPDLLFLSCLHGAKDRWNNIEALLGLALQVKRISSGAAAQDWPQVLAAAREAACKRRVTIGVAFAARVFGFQLPDEIARALASDPIARRLVQLLTPDKLGWDWGSNSRQELERLAWATASEDSVTTGAWRGLVRMSRPGPGDWQWIDLPPGAGWLYFVLRPVRLGIRLAKRL